VIFMLFPWRLPCRDLWEMVASCRDFTEGFIWYGRGEQGPRKTCAQSSLFSKCAVAVVPYTRDKGVHAALAGRDPISQTVASSCGIFTRVLGSRLQSVRRKR
jgi:hypothetical protein